MRRRLIGLLALLLILPLPAAAAGTHIQLIANDLEGKPLPGLRFACQGQESPATTRTGTTEFDLKAQQPPGQPLEIGLVAGAKQADEWFLVNTQVQIPAGAFPVKVVLMRRSAFRQIAAEARD